jgi:2-hydroxychromene-2-carboxylate isomerase
LHHRVTDTLTSSESPVADLPGGPYDIEFFFDPGCPFAWQTSVWIRRVAELRDVKVGWRFISLKFINEANNPPPAMSEAQQRGLRYHRICAAARERLGNDAVGALYKAFGDRYWYKEIPGDFGEKFAAATANVEPGAILAELGLPADLLAEADNESWDPLIRAESDEAFRRTGPDVGTPIISYFEADGTLGNSLFGPVISDVPADDETTVALYDALRVFVDYPGFAELKRTKRPPLDLPLFS